MTIRSLMVLSLAATLTAFAQQDPAISSQSQPATATQSSTSTTSGSSSDQTSAARQPLTPDTHEGFWEGEPLCP